MHDPLPGQPLGGSHVHPGIVGRIGRRREGAGMMPGAEENRSSLRNRHARLRHGRLQIRRRNLGTRRHVPEIDADPFHIAVLQRILVDRGRLRPEVARRVDMRAAVVGHGEEHDAVAMDVPGVGIGLFVRFPDAVNDRRLSRIGRSPVIELAAQVDDSHCSFLSLLTRTQYHRRLEARGMTCEARQTLVMIGLPE